MALLVADHAAVQDVAEVALEDPAGFALDVAVGARTGVDRLRAGLAAQLRDRHAVQDGVDAAVAAGVEAAGTFAVEAASGAVPLKRAKPPSVKRLG